MWAYDTLNRPIRLAFNVFFKRIYFTNFDQFRPGKPIFLAANHPTGFVEPIVFSVYLKSTQWHMTRGDLFAKPFFRFLLEGCNMFPVYRMREGFSDSRRNEAVFEYCDRKMLEKQCITIYPEGISAHEKRLRPLQKGLARFAFSAYEKHKQDDLQIIAVGVNYTHGHQFRGEAFFEAAEPIFVKDYWPTYLENPAQAIQNLTDEVEKRLRPRIVEIEKKADEPLAESLFELYRNERFLRFGPQYLETNSRLKDEKALAERVNRLDEAEKTRLSEQIQSYFSKLKKAGADDFGLCQKRLAGGGWTFLVAICFLPALVGRILTWPPAGLAAWVANTKTRNIEFRSSVVFGLGFLGYLIFFGSILLVLSLVFGVAGLAFALFLPLWGWASVLYFELLEDWKKARAFARLSENEKKSLVAERADLTKKAFAGLDFLIN